MDSKKAKDVLFSTKNCNKITTIFNNLSISDRQTILSDEKVKERLLKIANIRLLVTILIDLPITFRINFLNDIDQNKYSNEEIILINFLRLPDYNDFDYKELSHFQNLKDKQILTIIFRKICPEKLEKIILANYQQYIKDFAFFEYSKKSPNLSLKAEIISIIEENTLIAEIRKRKNKNQTTTIDIEEFIKLPKEKQNRIICTINSNNLIQEIIKFYQKKHKNYNQEELSLIFISLLSEFSYMSLIEMQSIIYLLDDSHSLELMKSFFKVILKFENDVEERYLNSLIYNFRQLSNKTDELYHICRSKPFSIINYLKTETIDATIDKIFENKITIEQYQKINTRKINKLNNMLTKIFHQHIKDNNKTSIILSYKLYMIFGYEYSIDLLNFKFGYISYQTLLKLLSECDIKDVEFKKNGNSYEPITNQEFINFLFGNKKDNNTTIKRMLRGELEIIKKEFANIYNNFKRFQTAIGNKIHLNKLLPLLERYFFSLLPSEYKLTNDILDNIIKSYKNSDDLKNLENLTNDEKKCILEACHFYHSFLEKRLTSSIPRVYGITEDNYSYEVLKLDDPLIMTLGYQTGCCFRLNGESKEFLRYCSESPHGRVILIKNDKGEICGMIPIIRNGNVINGNSIENNSKGNNFKIYKALKCAFESILKMSAYYEDKPIIAGLVTNLHSNCFSHRQIKSNIYPIRNTDFYTNYENTTYIVSANPSVDENNFQLYTPEAIYYDERPTILVHHCNIRNDPHKQEIDNRIKSILYKLNKDQKIITPYTKYIVCSEDWFIKLDWNGVSGECLDKDPRATIEYNAIKSYLKKRFSKDDYNINFEDTDLTSQGIASLIPKKLLLEEEQIKKKS